MKPLNWIPSFMMIWLLHSCGGSAVPPGEVAPQGKVTVAKSDKGFTLLKEGQPFQIKGASGDPQYLRELALAGGNCLRVYDTLGLAQVLDSAAYHGVMIIADLPLPKSRFLGFYRDQAKVAAQLNAYQDFVERHKDHPALLMWMLGNELDFPYKPNYAPFYRAFNDLLSMIHRVDGGHPVATAITNFQRRCITNIRLKIPALDLLGINTFGLLKDLEKDMSDFAWMWDGPYFVSEWSINGYWEVPMTAWRAPFENSGWKKKEELLQRFNQDMPTDDPRFLGSCLFYWGQKQESTATWFNTFTETGQPAFLFQAFATLNEGAVPFRPAPQVNYMMVDRAGGGEDIILKPGQSYAAELIFRHPPDSTLQTRWSLRSEDWYSLELDTLVPVVHYEHLLLNADETGLEFRAPFHEGPYRLFATLNYPGSISATVNTPVYVME